MGRLTLTAAATEARGTKGDRTRLVVVDDLGDEDLSVGVVGTGALLTDTARVDEAGVALTGGLIAGVETGTTVVWLRCARIKLAGVGPCEAGGVAEDLREREGSAREGQEG
jgi:hypothetical protein